MKKSKALNKKGQKFLLTLISGLGRVRDDDINFYEFMKHKVLSSKNLTSKV